MLGAQLFLADISEASNRARHLGTNHQAALAGSLLGPALGGFLADRAGMRAPFAFTGAAALLAALYGLARLPETSARHAGACSPGMPPSACWRWPVWGWLGCWDQPPPPLRPHCGMFAACRRMHVVTSPAAAAVLQTCRGLTYSLCAGRSAEQQPAPEASTRGHEWALPASTSQEWASRMLTRVRDRVACW